MIRFEDLDDKLTPEARRRIYARARKAIEQMRLEGSLDANELPDAKNSARPPTTAKRKRT